MVWTSHSEIATHAENLGMALQEQEEFAEAEALFRRVIQMTEHLHGDSAESLPMHIHALSTVCAKPIRRRSCPVDATWSKTTA